MSGPLRVGLSSIRVLLIPGIVKSVTEDHATRSPELDMLKIHITSSISTRVLTWTRNDQASENLAFLVIVLVVLVFNMFS